VARGFQVTAIQVLAPEELSPDLQGDLRLVDCESRTMQEVSFGRFRLAAYQRSVNAFVQGWQDFCKKKGVHALSVSSATSLNEVLLRQMRSARLLA
jgi:hypothetical protein